MFQLEKKVFLKGKLKKKKVTLEQYSEKRKEKALNKL